LRRWRLIEVEPGEMLTASRLRIDERIVHFLAGVPCWDDRLRGLVQPVAAPEELPGSHAAVAQRVADLWSKSQQTTAWPV
jgi:hypothetical protein